jgi:putative endonuclease
MKRVGTFYVYIVRCSDGTFYTGFTPHIRKRVALHNKGRGAKYTKYRRPVKLAWSKKYRYFKLAFLQEKRIKSLTRPQKINLISSKSKI